MKKKKQRRTFLAATVERVGVREGARVVSFVLCWTSTHAVLGHEPSAEEYAVDWKISASTAYRELRSFRAAWPEFSNPSEVAAVLGVNLDEGAVMPNPAMMPAPGGA